MTDNNTTAPWLSLNPHPACEAAAAPWRIYARLRRSTSGVFFATFKANGPIERLRLPQQHAPARRDFLWRTTCFEVFFKPVGASRYFELNFSPSTDWAAYVFEDYRTGMDIAAVTAEVCETRTSGDAFELSARCQLDEAGALTGAPLCANLCAVLENHNGEKSYWALAHHCEAPDFHHQDSFILKFGKE